MIQGRIQKGQVTVEDPIPPSWEGQIVNIVPLTAEDPMPDLEERIVALRELGPMEFEPGEREYIEGELQKLDRGSREAMGRTADPGK